MTIAAINALLSSATSVARPVFTPAELAWFRKPLAK